MPVVAIGASAGGMEAISELLGALPYNMGMSYIYIQHIPADHKSMLPHTMARHTKMQVLGARKTPA